MRMLGVFILTACLQAPLAHAQAAPDPVLPGQVLGDPDQIARLMAERGMPVTKGTDVQGLPMLESRVDDMLFNVYFYDCDTLCRRMQFVTSFRLTQPMTAEDANDWNRNNPFGKVVIADSGDPYIEMDIGVAADGLGRKNFDDALDTWRDVLGEVRASLTH